MKKAKIIEAFTKASHDSMSMDIMRVHWRLIDNCNYDCVYCSWHSNNMDCVFSRERILSMAWKILNYPAFAHHVTLTGGEPTLHPALPDLVAWLSRAPRNILLTLETNGSREPAYYANIARRMPQKQMRFVISAHPAFAQTLNLSRVIAEIARHGQIAHARLMRDPACPNEFEQLRTDLIGLRKEIPFVLEFTPLVGARGEPAADTGKSGSGILPAGPEDIPFPETTSMQIDKFQTLRIWSPIASLPPSAVGGKYYRYESPATLQIEPDGRFACAPGAHVSSIPLWEMETDDFVNCADIAACEPSTWQNAENCQAPVFEDAVSAKNFADDVRERLGKRQWHMSPLPNPLSPELDARDALRLKIQNLGILQAARHENGESISLEAATRIYQILTDEQSRQNFLAFLSHTLNGDATGGQLKAPVAEPGEIVLLAGVHLEREEVSGSKAKGNGRLIEIDDFLADGNKESLSVRLRNGRGFCSGIVLRSQPEHIDHLKAVIHDFSPRLEMVLGSSLELPLWLINSYPDYSINIANENGRFIFIASPPSPVLKMLLRENTARPFVSVVIGTSESSSQLQATLDSVILQNGADYEIIVANRSHDENNSGILSRYQRRLGKSLCILSSRCGNMLNAASGIARGDNILFLEAGDMLPPGCFRQSRALLDKHKDAEIVWLNGRTGLYSPENALNRILGNLHQSVIAIFSRHLILRSRAGFGAGGVNARLYFLLRAFYQTSAIVGAEQNVITAASTGAANPTHVSGHPGDVLEIVEDFYALHNLRPPASFARNLLKAAQEEWLKQPISHDRESDKRASSHVLHGIGRSPSAISAMIEHICRVKEKPRKNISRIEQPSKPGISYIPAGSADNPFGCIPELTVIMPNYNKAKYLPRCMASILAQSYSDFELIVIDDASTDESSDIFAAYAAGDARIRLYFMENNVRPGACRNLGLSKARGKYIIFVDSDDICAPDYFKIAMETITTKMVDMVVYSSVHKNECCETVWENNLEDGICNTKQALALFFRGDIEPTPWAKIYERNFLINQVGAFPQYIYHQDVPFLYNALKTARSIATCKDVVYISIESADSIMRPKEISRLRLRSSIEFIGFMQSCIEEWDHDKAVQGQDPAKLLRWHMENVFYDICSAFLDDLEYLPLEREEFAILGKSEYFLRELAVAYMAAGSDRRAKPVNKDLAPHEPLTPLVSVLVKNHAAFALDPILSSLSSQHLRDFEVELIPATNSDSPCANHTVSRGSPALNGKYVCLVDNSITLENNALLHSVALLESDPDLAFAYFGENNGESLPEDSIIYKHAILERFSTCKLQLENPIIARKQWLKDQQPFSMAFYYNIFLGSKKAVIISGAFTKTSQAKNEVNKASSLPLNLDKAFCEIETAASLIGGGLCRKHKKYLRSRVRHLANRDWLSKITALRARDMESGAPLTKDMIRRVAVSRELFWIFCQNSALTCPRKKWASLREVVSARGEKCPLTLVISLLPDAGALEAEFQKLDSVRNAGIEIILLSDFTADEKLWQKSLEWTLREQTSGLYLTKLNELPVASLLAAARGNHVVFLDGIPDENTLKRYIALTTARIDKRKIRALGAIQFCKKGFLHCSNFRARIDIIYSYFYAINRTAIYTIIRNLLFSEA